MMAQLEPIGEIMMDCRECFDSYSWEPPENTVVDPKEAQLCQNCGQLSAYAKPADDTPQEGAVKL